MVDIDGKKGKSIILEGKTFVSFAEACRHYNLDYRIVSSRLTCGWSIEEAFELVDIDSKKKAKEITVEGKTFKSITEAAKYYNLSNIVIVYTRLRNGWSIEEAFGLIERDTDRNYKQITIEGKTFKSIKEACKYYNLNYGKIINRLHKGWSIEEAFELVNIDSKKKVKEITLKGKTFPTIKDAAEYYNLNYRKIINRLHKSWTLEEAFELVPRQKKKK